MQVRTHRAWPLVALAAVGVLAGCGPSSPDRLAGHSPRQVAVIAERLAARLSYRTTGSFALGLDPSRLRGVSVAERQALARVGDRLAVDFTALRAGGDAQELTLAVPALGLTDMRILRIGPAGYVSPGGSGWYRTTLPTAGAAAQRTAVVLGQTLAAAATRLVSPRDVGPATEDGLATEHYHGAAAGAPIAAYLQQSLGAALAAAPGGAARRVQLGQLLDAIGSPSISVDSWITRSTGRLDRATIRIGFSVDFGAIARALPTGLLSPSPGPTPPAPSPAPTAGGGAGPTGGTGLTLPQGTLGVTLAVTARWSGYGAAVRLAAPGHTRPMSALGRLSSGLF
ncbi:MAG TPA: hypothetical protein VNN74_07210 [Candidatus Micrarchaeia archaeon]|nr:hypothetical protein [Candidatus Micrarchaeia archaeon]